MEIFNLTLTQMMTMFTLIFVGYILRNLRILPEKSDNVIAKLETCVFGPALLLYVQSKNCTLEAFCQDYVFLLYGAGIAICAVLLSYPLSRLFVRNSKGDPKREYSRNIYKYALSFGNYGFIGMYIVKFVFGEVMLYKLTLFTSLIEMICLVWGMYVLVPKDQNAPFLTNLKKGLLKPQVIALFLGIFLGLTGLSKYIPTFVGNALKNAGDCYGPVAMVLAGYIIGGYKWKEVIGKINVYVAALFRLILIPSAMMGVLMLFGTSKEIMTIALFAFATPVGMNTIVFPTAFGGDPKTGASLTMISTAMSLITLPLMYLTYIVLL